MGRAAIVGVGMTRFGRHPDKHFIELGVEAIEMALEDANMDFKEIQEGFCSRVYLPSSTGARIMEHMGRTGMAVPDIEGACGAAATGLRQARLMVESGQCDIALAFGVEKMPKGFMSPEVLYDNWQCRMGLSQNPMYWALNARRHMHEYGTTEEQLAKVAVKGHKNGALNPNALFQKPFTIQEVLNSPMVLDPLRLYMITSPDEGAAAVIICNKKIAKSYNSKPIEIAACVNTISKYPLFNASSYCTTETGNPTVYAMTAKKAYEEAGIGPEDLDVAEVQDGDAFSEIEYYEELGFCKKGEGGRLIDEGITEIGGKLPVNPSGGLQAKGEPIGASHFGQLFEIVKQLRGEAGPRQISNPRVGLAQVFGAWGHCGITILKSLS
jgi:acetyl-CoA C-acetyltransferase